MLDNITILLASKSPRRKMLLESLGFKCEVVYQNAEESYPDDLKPELVPEFLANLKAQSVDILLGPNQILLASDTIVTMHDKIYHKPKNYQDAFEILSELSGQTHKVITGVCLKYSNTKISFSETSLVSFDDMNSEEINYYIEQYKPYDKAGAYAIQEWIGNAKIKKISGTYSNIVGLPTQKVYSEIKKLIKI